jgi:hypothetical protein
MGHPDISAGFPTGKSLRGFRRGRVGFGFPARGGYTRVNSLDAARQSVLSAADERGGGHETSFADRAPFFQMNPTSAGQRFEGGACSNAIRRRRGA